jgi:hypothetical protein
VTFAVTCWKWKPAQPSGPRFFDSKHVNVLRAMVARHLPIPHRFVCVTDDTDGLDSRIEAVPMPPQTFDSLVDVQSLLSPHHHKYNKAQGWRRRRISAIPPKRYFPSCYRRLWLFSEEAKALGDRILALDVDVIVTGSLLPLVAREESFVGWCDERNERPRVAGGVYLLTAGSHTDVWTDFDPETSPRVALEAGYKGSDQAWMSYKLCPSAATWGRADGLTKITWLEGEPDESTRLVFTAGYAPPWNRDEQRKNPWLKKYWTL